MIISRLSGQLGNQLFAYSTAYALARKNDETLAIYKFEYNTVALHSHYQLDNLKLDPFNSYIGIPISLYIYTFKQLIKKIIGVLSKSKLKFTFVEYSNKNIDIIKESTLQYRPLELYKSKNKHLLEGFWQSPRYFDQYRDDLLRQFQPSFQLSEETINLLKELSKTEYSVSVHIRRCDYVKIGWCLPMEYYDRALAKMQELKGNCTFYVFSDDIEWVKQNLNTGGYPTVFVERSKAINPFEDIWAMKHCNANIIANSSFSWWGAYLNSQKDKIVIAPQQMINSNRDVFLSDWLIM